jgi:hypothetical protein
MRFYLIWIVLLAATQHNVFGWILKCTFEVQSSTWGVNDYTCLVNNKEPQKDDRKVTAVDGQHLPGKNISDVTRVLISKQHFPRLPLNLGEYFKNLTIYSVLSSKVAFLSDNDLEGLEKLKVFDVAFNRNIMNISKDFFKSNTGIEKISFSGCNLKYINAGTFDSLMNLKEAHFEGNVCIDETLKGDDCTNKEVFNSKLKQCYSATSKSNKFEASESIFLVVIVAVVRSFQ